MQDQKRIPKRPSSGSKKNSGARRVTTALILLAVILVLTVGTIVLNNAYRRRATAPGSPTSSENTSFGITSVTVSGNHRYGTQEILYVSGLSIGKSVWSVSVEQAESNILAQCPYVDRVTITSPAFGEYLIDVVETVVFGAFGEKGEWIWVGKNGNMLGKSPMESDVPSRMIYLKGLTYSGNGVGKPASDDRSVEIVRTLAQAMDAEEIQQIVEIDLTDKADLTMNWNNQITIRLGNDTRLPYEIRLVHELLPHILETHGSQARGILDLTAYSSESLPDQAFFTPQNI